jgi:hypothetical protein
MGARGEAEGLTYVPYPYCIVLLCSLITWVCLVLLYGDRAVESYCLTRRMYACWVMLACKGFT